MFVFISLPYNARYHRNVGTHLWFFYKQLDSFSEYTDEAAFIGWEKNYVFPSLLKDDSWEKNQDVRKKLEYSLPSENLLKKARIIPVDQNIFSPLEEKLKSNNLVWSYLIQHEYEPLKNFIKTQLDELKKKSSIEAIVLCCNSPSVKAAAHELGIPVIHTEIGPTRKPQYLQTAYWDLSGVNGHTEAAERFYKAEHELKNSLLSKRELRALLMDEKFFQEVDRMQDAPEYETGVAGQVDDDSNIIAYSNGFNNLELLKFADFHFGKDNVLYRNHPGAQTCFTSTLDRSKSPAVFFKRIKKLLTINSSMALEASLMEKPVMVLGDSPFKLLSDDVINCKNEKDGHIDELNFLCLNYIIPYELIFDRNYYNWRLSMPSETDIRKYHLNFYLSKQGFASLEDFRKNIPIPQQEKTAAAKEKSDLKISTGDIPFLLESERSLKEYVQQCRNEIDTLTSAYEYNKQEAEKLSAKLESEITHYRQCLDNCKKELDELKEASEYNKSEAENFKKLWQYQEQETKNFKKTYELNKAEAEKLAAKLDSETKHYQKCLNNSLEEISNLKKVCDYNQKEAKNYKELWTFQKQEAENFKKLWQHQSQEAENFKKLWQYQTKETENFKKVYELNKTEAEKLTEKLDSETKHYQQCLDNCQKENSSLSQALEYNQKEAEHFKKLWQYQEQETKHFKEAYEYNRDMSENFASQLKAAAEQNQRQQADLQTKLTGVEQNYISVQQQLNEKVCILENCQKRISDLETEKSQYIIKFAYHLNEVFNRIFKKVRGK